MTRPGAGADDYLVKPHALPELQAARLNALIKRQRRQLAGTRLTVGDLTLETENYTVKRAGQRLSLSPIQFQLLAQLRCGIRRRSSPGPAGARDLGQRPAGLGHAAQSHLQRCKVIDKPFDRPLLHTHLTFGFRLAPVDEPLPSTQPETDSAAVAAWRRPRARRRSLPTHQGLRLPQEPAPGFKSRRSTTCA